MWCEGFPWQKRTAVNILWMNGGEGEDDVWEDKLCSFLTCFCCIYSTHLSWHCFDKLMLSHHIFFCINFFPKSCIDVSSSTSQRCPADLMSVYYGGSLNNIFHNVNLMNSLYSKEENNPLIIHYIRVVRWPHCVSSCNIFVTWLIIQ